MPTELVKQPHRPTLGDLLNRSPRKRVNRWLAGLAGALLIGALGAGVATRADRLKLKDYSQSSPIAFKFRYSPDLKKVAPQGDELVRMERHSGETLLDSFSVAPLKLSRYQQQPSGVLPVIADREQVRLARLFSDFELVEEGKARIHGVPGYGLVFRGRVGKRRFFGREVLLPMASGGSKGKVAGVRLLVLSTPAAGATKSTDAGAVGATRLPLYSFEFKE